MRFSAPLLCQPCMEPCGTRTSPIAPHPRRASPSLQPSHRDLGTQWAIKLVELRVKTSLLPSAHWSAPSPLAPPHRPAFGACVHQHHSSTSYPLARFPPALVVMGSQQSNATSNASQPVSYSARQVQLNTGAGRGGIATLTVAPCSPRWLQGKATQGGANPPGFYRPQGRHLSQIWLPGAVSLLCLYFSSPGQAFQRALWYPALSGVEEGWVSGRDARQSPPILCPFEVSQAGAPSRSPPWEALAWLRVDFLASAAVQSSDEKSRQLPAGWGPLELAAATAADPRSPGRSCHPGTEQRLSSGPSKASASRRTELALSHPGKGRTCPQGLRCRSWSQPTPRHVCHFSLAPVSRVTRLD